MNTTARARTSLRLPRATALIIAAAVSGTGLLLAGCSGAGSSGGTAAAPQPAARAAAGFGAALAPTAAGHAAAGVAQPAAAQATRLAPGGQSLIQTASLAVQAKDVTGAARRAVAIVTAAGGYTSNEQESLGPGSHAIALVSLELKIPVAQFGTVLDQLRGLGIQTSFSQQALDVTQQVADVGSRVTSEQAAITQLRALLRRAGSVSDLLGVQDQINVEESSLESLLAQQRALGHETTFGTVSLRLAGHHPKAVQGKKKKHGFVAGLSAGWHALRLLVSGLLTGLGAALPFALIAALAGGIAYGGRRRAVRRKSRPTAAQ